MYAAIAVAGRVKIQAISIFLATPHLTAESLLVAPTPIILVVITCVVLTGSPKELAPIIIAVAAVSAANP